MNTIVIAPEFCGPRDSGNGGYVCGLISNYADFDSAVILRKPPPLSKPLTVITVKDKVSLMDGDQLIGEAIPEILDLDTPPAPDFNQAREASGRYIGYENHVFPTCFVCGPDRHEGDGLRIFAGRVNGNELVAAPWIPADNLAGDDGLVRKEFHWAALDCPGYFSITDVIKKSVLGKMSAKVLQKVKPGERCVITGWPIKHDGRKHFSGTAIFREDGSLAAIAHAIWIDI